MAADQVLKRFSGKIVKEDAFKASVKFERRHQKRDESSSKPSRKCTSRTRSWAMTGVFLEKHYGQQNCGGQRVISTGNDHAQGNLVEICTAGYIEYSNNTEAQKAAEQAPSTVAPVVPNIEDLKPVQL